MMNDSYDTLVIGAGPAGLAAAISLAQGGWRVGVVERLALPREKICGGFIGPENRSLLEKLGVLEEVFRVAAPLTKLTLHADTRQSISIPINLNNEHRSGFGISRAAFDHILLMRARELGVAIFDQCSYSIDQERIIFLKMPSGQEKIQARHVIEATGSPKDIKEKSGVGAGGIFENCASPAEEVSLYFVHGGHLGINRFESGRVNACYVVDDWLFEACNKNMAAVFAHFLDHYPSLKEQFENARQVSGFKGISVCRPEAARFSREGNFLVGDAVDCLNPVIGGGNSQALASGTLLAQILLQNPAAAAFEQLEQLYRRQWNKSFAARVRASWIWGQLSHQHFLARNTIRVFRWHEAWLTQLFRYNHQPLEFQV